MAERDLKRRARQVMHAHDAYLTGTAHPSIRPLVLESWRRSLVAGVDPERGVAPVRFDDDDVARLRAGHPLAAAMPVIRRLLLDSVVDAGLLLALSDAAGRLLWVEGHPGLRSRAEGMAFVAGADWSEATVGTNAPGTALALDQPVQIFAAEHLSRPVTPWSCSAAPIHDPDTGAVMGVLDLTGGGEVASPQSLMLVRATVAAVEAEMRVDRLRALTVGRRPATPARARVAELQVLGAHQAVLRQAETVTRLSLRHSEILLLLLAAPDGLTAAELAVALSERDAPEVTIRAEMSRLRCALGDVELLSRPYRVVGPMVSDLAQVRRAVEAGNYRQAVAAYHGPVLPTSEAPAVVELREDLHSRLRAGLMRSADPDALLCFADTDHGRDDLALWRRALDILPTDSPRRGEIEVHVHRLLIGFG